MRCSFEADPFFVSVVVDCVSDSSSLVVDSSAAQVSVSGAYAVDEDNDVGSHLS